MRNLSKQKIIDHLINFSLKRLVEMGIRSTLASFGIVIPEFVIRIVSSLIVKGIRYTFSKWVGPILKNIVDLTIAIWFWFLKPDL